jgi:hypothetical protein
MKFESNNYFSFVILELMKPNLIKMKNKFQFKMEYFLKNGMEKL